MQYLLKNIIAQYKSNNKQLSTDFIYMQKYSNYDMVSNVNQINNKHSKAHSHFAFQSFVKNSLLLSAMISYAILAAAHAGETSLKNSAFNDPTNQTSKLVKVDKKPPVNEIILDGSLMVTHASTGKYPAPIAAMVDRGKGVKVLDAFNAAGGLTGFVLSAANGEHRVYYVTPDGSVAIYGMLFDKTLNNLTAYDFAKFTNPLSNSTGTGTLFRADKTNSNENELIDSSRKANIATVGQGRPSLPGNVKLGKSVTVDSIDIWSASALVTAAPITPSSTLAQTSINSINPAWDAILKSKGVFVEGKGLPVYIVFDLACPYCHKAYRDTRSLLDKLEIHWLPVGSLGANSQLLAERFFRSSDKGAAMVSALSKELIPAESLSIEVATLINENATILKLANVQSVPFIMYEDNKTVKLFTGAPSAVQLKEFARLSRSLSAR